MDGRTDGRTDRQTGGGGGFYFFNVENSIKREIRKNCFSKKNFTPIFFYVGNSMKREENMKY